MSYPLGVQVGTLTFSNPVTFLGREATETKVTIQATSSVVWAATGAPIDNFPETVNPGPGMPGSLTAPYVDQEGFRDQSGASFKMWAYIVTRETTLAGVSVPWTVRKKWQPLLGQTEVDFDLLPDGPASLSLSVPIPPVTSVAGLTSVVAAEELARALGQHLDAVLPERLSVENIAAGLSPKLDAEEVGAPDGVAPLGPDSRVPDAYLPGRLGATALNASYVSAFVVIGPGVDPLGATDSTAAIQAVIDSLPVGGGIVWFPAGHFKITSALNIRSNITFVGAGEQSTFIEQVTVGAHGIAGVDLWHVGLRDLHITGPGQGVGGAGDGVNFSLSGTGGNATFYVDMSNVYIEKFGRDGLSIQTPIVSSFKRVITFRSGRHGQNLHSSGDIAGTSCSLTACFSAGSWGAGYRLKQMAYSSLDACAADSNGIGYEYDTCVGISENGCGSEEPYNFNAHNAGYDGKSRKVFNTKATFNSPYMIGNVGTAFWVTNNSVVTINTPFEGSPGNPDDATSNPTVSLKVDAGCRVALNNPSFVTPTSLAPDTTTTMPDALSAMSGSGATQLIAGQEVTMDPFGSASTTMGGSGSVRLTYFTAAVGGTFTKLRSITSATAAGATPTLCKMGVYSVASNGNLTLIAQTDNDTTMWAAVNTAYERATLASYSLVAGQRYAFAHLIVTAAAVPALVGKSSVGAAAINAEFSKSPRRVGTLGSATDLPSAPTFDLVGDMATAYYGACA